MQVFASNYWLRETRHTRLAARARVRQAARVTGLAASGLQALTLLQRSKKKRALLKVRTALPAGFLPELFSIQQRRPTRRRDVDGLRRAAGATPPAARRINGDRAAARVAGESRRALRFAKGRPARLLRESRGRGLEVRRFEGRV